MTNAKVASGPTEESLRVLLADDDAAVWLPLMEIPLADAGIELLTETNAKEVLGRIGRDKPDALLLDVLFPAAGGDQRPLGREILERVVEAYPDLPVVMFTTTMADEGFRWGKSDFPSAAFVFSKSVFHEEWPEDQDPYEDLARRLREAVADARERATLDSRLGFVIGRTVAMRQLATSLAKVAVTDLPVLITGESGTGKELVADALQALSPRNGRPYVKQNCGVISDETLESALFGHEKGAFTGANGRREGLFEAADGGTLFLDEVQTMSERLQQSLLRVLQEGVLRRMGGTTERRVDVRVIAATNEDLEQRIEQGCFRGDLYHRLNRVSLQIPKLRERKEDIPELFARFVTEANRRLGKTVSRQCRPDLRELLEGYDWPGNIRELRNTVEEAVTLSGANLLTPEDFPRLAERKPLASKVTAEPALSDPADWGSRPLSWDWLRNIKGEQRKALLLDYLNEWQRRTGSRPTHTEMANDLGTSPANMRQVLSKAGLSLREPDFLKRSS